MNSNRFPPDSPFNHNSDHASNMGGISSIEKTKISQSVKLEDIRKVLANCSSEEKGYAIRLEDEFSRETIEMVVRECRTFLENSAGKNEVWNSIGEYLESELWEFSRLKEDLENSQRKCAMVQQKSMEASNPENGHVNRNRLMACAMLLAETEMQRDHLQERISMVIDEFASRILQGWKNDQGCDALELRLRGVFGRL